MFFVGSHASYNAECPQCSTYVNSMLLVHFGIYRPRHVIFTAVLCGCTASVAAISMDHGPLETSGD